MVLLLLRKLMAALLFSESELGSSVEVVGLELLEASSDPLEANGPSLRLRFKKLPLVRTLCLKRKIRNLVSCLKSLLEE